MNSRMALLALSVFAIGVFAMPSTLSLFSGQHTFSDNGSDPQFCWKCHNDVYVEMNWYGGGDAPDGSHSSLMNCNVCHRTGQLSGFLEDYGISPSSPGYDPGTNLSNSSAHAAVTVECVFCHDTVLPKISNANESHSNFYNEANQSSLLKGGNEACVGCHTRTTVSATFVRKGGLNITADITSGSWNVSVSVNQTNVNSTVIGQ